MEESPKIEEVRSWLIKSRQDLEAFEELRNAAVTLTPYAVALRYPGDLPDISKHEAMEAVEYARQIWRFILALLPQEIHIQSDTHDNQGGEDA